MEINGTRGQRLLREYVCGWIGTKQSFAEACGVSPTLLSHFLSGRRRPTLEAVFGIQRATKGKVPADTWLTDEAWEEPDVEEEPPGDSAGETGVRP